MEATAPSVPWWSFALTGLVVLACLGLLTDNGYPWSVQVVSIMLVVGGLSALVRHRHK
ncbi:MAG TPA: hypothetical protein VF384_09305 [Planctomycetota bacterium]